MHFWNVALPVLAFSAAADAQGIKFNKIIAKKPALSKTTNTKTTPIATQASANSVVNHMNSLKSGGSSTPSTSSAAKAETTTTTKATTSMTTMKTSPKTTKTTTKAPAKTTTKAPVKTTTKAAGKTTAKGKPNTSAKTTTKAPIKKASPKTTTTKAAKVPRQATTTCPAEPLLVNYIPNPNTPNGFLIDSSLFNKSKAASTYPAGYSTAFTNAYGSIVASNYLGFYPLSAYDPSACANICNGVAACQAFNIYYERTPSLTPGTSCRNPSAASEVRCTLYGSKLDVSQTTNVGSWRFDFMVVVQGSNGYNKNALPSTPSGYSAPIPLAGAVDVSQTPALVNSYINSNFYLTTAFNPQVCADMCTAATVANSLKPCNYFNALEINLNGIFQGTYCQLYNQDVSLQASLYKSTSNGVNYDLFRSYGYLVNGAARQTTSAPPLFVTPSPTYVPSAALPTFVATSTVSTKRTSATPVSKACADLGSTSYTSLNGLKYNIKCGYDLDGYGDVGNTESANIFRSFTDCFTLCDTFPSCSAFALNNGNCYFKNLTGVTNAPLPLWWVSFAWLQGSYPAGDKIL